MSEVTFAKAFLATLDKRPVKLPADHVGDPRQYPNQSPTTLPKPSTPYPRPSSPSSTPTAAPTLTLTLKPTRPHASTPPLTLPSLDPAQTTIHDLKSAYATHTSLSRDKIKLLYNRKPTADLKTLAEMGVVGGAEGVEMGVMIVGGVGGTTPAAGSPAGGATPAVGSPGVEVPPAVPAAAAAATAGEKMDVDVPAAGAGNMEAGAEAVLAKEEFWRELEGWLAQRVGGEGEGKRVAGVFRGAWGSR